MVLERRSRNATVSLEDRADGPPRIRGVAAVYYRAGDKGTEYELWRGAVERIMPGAFSRAIREDDVRGLFNHDPTRILGRTKAKTLKLEDSEEGLRYVIDPSDTSIYRDVAEHLRRGDIDGSSFAFRVTDETWRDEGPDLEVREIKAVELYDVGPVTYPAYEGASAGFRSADGDGYEEARRSHQEWRLRQEATEVASRDRAASQGHVAALLANLAAKS